MAKAYIEYGGLKDLLQAALGIRLEIFSKRRLGAKSSYSILSLDERARKIF